MQEGGQLFFINNQRIMVSIVLDLNPLVLNLLGVLQYKIYSNNPRTENNVNKRTQNIMSSILPVQFRRVTNTCLLIVT